MAMAVVLALLPRGRGLRGAPDATLWSWPWTCNSHARLTEAAAARGKGAPSSPHMGDAC